MNPLSVFILGEIQFLKVSQDLLYYLYLMQEHRYPLLCQ